MRKSSILILMMMAGVMIYLSCRKTDRLADREPVNNEFRFFNEHAPTDPLVVSVRQFVKTQNEKYHFAENVMKKIGYPQWNKALIAGSVQAPNRRTNNDDSVNVAYVPFVRDSQHYVNAALMVKITPTDTSFQYLQDWQYASFADHSTDSTWSAKDAFHIFAKLDNTVFGRTEFRILDKKLLEQNVQHSLDSMGVSLDSFQVIARLVPSQNSSRNNLWTLVTWCDEFEVCVMESTAARNNIIPSSCSSGVFLVYSVCTSTWEYITSSGGGGSGGPSGGGSGGGWNPPDNPCVPTQANNNCGQGWVIVPDPVPPAEPVDTLLKKCAEVANKYRDSLSSLCESEHKERFFNIVNYNNQLDTFRVLTGPSDDEVKPNYYMTGGRILKGTWHYHPKYSDGTPGSWPSGGDVAQLFDKPEGFVMIIDADNARYALVVENAAKMNAWMKIFGNGPLQFPDKVYNMVLNDPRAYSTGSTYVQMTKEMLLTALGNSSTCGIGLYQAASANATTFIKVN